MKSLILALSGGAMALAPIAAAAQETNADEAVMPEAAVDAVVTTPVSSTKKVVLPANTEILLSMNEELNTKKNKEGDTFYMSVVHDVILDNHIVIPKGSRATGEITWKTGKGAFGKSGKMEIELHYLELNGQRVPLVGTFRQEGEGNTVATVAGVVAVGVFAVFITGKTGVIPRGRELMVHTKDDLPVAFAAAAAPPAPRVIAKPVAETEAAAEPAADEAEAAADATL